MQQRQQWVDDKQRPHSSHHYHHYHHYHPHHHYSAAVKTHMPVIIISRTLPSMNGLSTVLLVPMIIFLHRIFCSSRPGPWQLDINTLIDARRQEKKDRSSYAVHTTRPITHTMMPHYQPYYDVCYPEYCYARYQPYYEVNYQPYYNALLSIIPGRTARAKPHTLLDMLLNTIPFLSILLASRTLYHKYPAHAFTAVPSETQY